MDFRCSAFRWDCSTRTGCIAGVVYDPTRDELFAAEQGSGALLTQQRNQASKMQVSKIANLSESLVATGFPSHKRHKNPNIHFYHQITLRTHGVRRAGSAALDLCCVASGRFDGFWEFNLNPWDTAAGVLIVEEAGGKVTGFQRRALPDSTAVRPWRRMACCTPPWSTNLRRSSAGEDWNLCPMFESIEKREYEIGRSARYSQSVSVVCGVASAADKPARGRSRLPAVIRSMEKRSGRRSQTRMAAAGRAFLAEAGREHLWH